MKNIFFSNLFNILKLKRKFLFVDNSFCIRIFLIVYLYNSRNGFVIRTIYKHLQKQKNKLIIKAVYQKILKMLPPSPRF